MYLNGNIVHCLYGFKLFAYIFRFNDIHNDTVYYSKKYVKSLLHLKNINFRRHGGRLRRQIWAKKMSHNVPAVFGVPARPIKQTAGLRAGWNVPE
jgi:hypothetical protein